MDKFNQLLHSFLEGQISFIELEKRWVKMYMGSGSDIGLNEEQKDFLDEVNEQMEYTTENPTDEARKYNWINYPEFREWLQNQINISTKLR